MGDGVLYDRLSSRPWPPLAVQHAHLSAIGLAGLVAASPAEPESVTPVWPLADLLLLDTIAFFPLRVALRARHRRLADAPESVLDLGRLLEQLARPVARV